jgi:DNA processing protein
MQRLDVPYLLTLSLVPRLGKATLHRILQKLQFKPQNFKELCEVAQPFIKLSQDQLEAAFNQAEHILQEHKSAGITVIGIDDPEFPQQLLTIANPPLLLYTKGNINCLKPQRSVAVIGTRQPTDYGRRMGIRIAKRFAEQGLIVVSGLAQGCDTAGHQGCLQGKGHTVAVLAHGLDKVYPSENRELAKKILDSDGCLVSEYPIGNKLFKNQFVERDRIQSGLSSAVVIIETDIKGGTMHTARFCLEQKRVLACIDYKPEHRSEKSRGNEQLISEGKAMSLKVSEDLKNFMDKVFKEFISTDQSLIQQQTDIFSVTNKDDNMTLNKNDLAKRLHVSPSTITTNMKKDHKSFQEWSRKKDPEGHPWEYREDKKLFEIAF